MKKILSIMLVLAVLLSAAACVRSMPKLQNSGEDEASVSFVTKDTQGNEINSKELFEKNKITMINIWASWCGPCARELPELQTLSSELSELGCGLIGILDDGDTQNGLSTAKQLMDSNGITYPVLISNNDIRTQLAIQYYPTTFFVDGSGRPVGEPIIGAQVDRYLPAVRALLEENAG